MTQLALPPRRRNPPHSGVATGHLRSSRPGPGGGRRRRPRLQQRPTPNSPSAAHTPTSGAMCARVTRPCRRPTGDPACRTGPAEVVTARHRTPPSRHVLDGAPQVPGSAGVTVSEPCGSVVARATSRHGAPRRPGRAGPEAPVVPWTTCPGLRSAHRVASRDSRIVVSPWVPFAQGRRSGIGTHGPALRTGCTGHFVPSGSAHNHLRRGPSGLFSAATLSGYSAGPTDH